MTDFLAIIGILGCYYLFRDLWRWNDFKPVCALWGREASLAVFEYMVARWGWSLGVFCVLLANPSGKPSPYTRASMCCGAFGIASALSVSFWAWWRRRGSPEPLQLSRGYLFDGVSAVRRKAGIRTGLSIYLLPDELLAGSRNIVQPAVLIPRQLLDRLSRDEIDALVAYQLRRPGARRFWAYSFLGVLVCGTACSAALHLLKVGTAGHWLVFSFLVIAEMPVLSFVWRRRTDRLYLWAMGVAGNPEAFASTMAALSRLSTGAPDTHLIRRLARIAEIPPDRIPALLQERPCPAEERYPTVGDYMTVGF